VVAGADPTPWCAALARALDEPLPGTAPVAPRWVCVEHRGTWPSDITAHRDDAVRAFLARVTAAGWRPLLVRRAGRRPADGPTRVFLADTDPARPRVTVLRVVDPAELAGLVLPGPGEPLPGAAVTDPMLMVCTHGRRDRCCAVDGRALARAVLGTGEVDVWECTHLGGHRFAPTALVLPYGTLWAHLDDASLGGIVTQTADVEAAAPRYRGCSGLDGPDAQALERAVFERVGWSLFARRRIVDVGGGAVRLVVLDGGRTESVWEATVQAGRVLPVPECGRPPENAPKLEAEHIVTRLARIA
jgi:hypothetical protein